MANVFLSYARTNAALAERVADVVRAAGRTIWFDRELPAHRPYGDVIASELEAADCVIVLWSHAAAESQWVRSEADRARETNKLVQARLDDTRLPMPFDQMQCVDLAGWRGGRSHPGWAQLWRSVEALIAGGAPATPAPPAPPTSPNRRLVIGGAAAAALTAGGGYFWTHRGRSQLKLDPAVMAVMQQAKLALYQTTPEGQNQAIGLFRQVIDSHPDTADAWGGLSISYAWSSHYRSASEAGALRDRARDAARQALSLDPQNARAMVGEGMAQPFIGNWQRIGTALRRASALDPHGDIVSVFLAIFLLATGRPREAALRLGELKNSEPTPAIYFTQATALWAAGQIEALDSLLVKALQLYPTHYALWFTRFYSFMFGGRTAEALAMTADLAHRPSNIEPSEIEAVADIARAIQTPSPASADAISRTWMKRAHDGVGLAENAAQFMAALGRIDDAFTVLRAYYFSEGFDCGEVRFARSAGSATPHDDRLTTFLFNPAMKPVRADPRFTALVDRLGLTAYWRASKEWPDHWKKAPR